MGCIMLNEGDQVSKVDDETASVVVVTPEEISAAAADKEKNVAVDKSESSDEADEEKKEKKKKKQVVGIVPESKDLYAKFDKHGNRSWTEKKPDDFEEAAENEETEKYAVIVRKHKLRDADSAQSLAIDSLIIQSPYLKRLLADVLDGYPGILTNLARLKLSAPFECFVHRWDRFEAARNDTSLEAPAKAHVELLHAIMRQELGHVIQLRDDYLKNRAVTFEHAWTLFPPGCLVVGHKQGKPVAARFSRGHYASTNCGEVYVLECRIIDWDGSIMGWSDLTLQIRSFAGTMPFASLPCYPLDHHHDAAGFRAALTDRGRRFESLAGFFYRGYSSVALYYQEEGAPRRETVQSRIVIDGANWEKENHARQLWLTPLHKEDVARDRRRRRLRRCGSFSSFSSDDASVDGDDSGDEKGRGKRLPLTEEQLLLTSPIVRGYALQNKRWMEFYVDDVAAVQFDEDAFSSLVMPADKKDLILAFAQSQARYKDAFDDVISGKGKGIIVLLSGGPGIGKTLTAESVAEEMRVPLFAMSAGDLGSSAYEVEQSLGKILALVASWNAVLLLDECDVFLEERSVHDMERNRIVAIFLRTLEYYQGILFLTTNRVRNMDPAFQSRIHVSLQYPPLDAAARAAVWRSFLGRTVGLGDTGLRGHDAHDVSDAEVDALSALDLNGRVIKNILKAANLLACHRGEKLAMGHLQTVLRVEGHSL
ncbi:ATPase family associated with various cellular activities (AAA) domain-containing protein [Hirsutella rhossiliensis]|uniref:ATPase family associated with various cellular activities (AAA) domain-containing protein n=1 Tax=Hirsutella rhossiliensis TaxID=111463 RepID=A0A9P8NBC6_9HYPO|nr:ATPase family associated with various cellular activities (AAA) domain-containing protein [Hirsutella rhossiliensis]KAH0968037.1 ATPase family associated with various cellular activities (AAA) domain-containing protein [Hirsutella rhossiliensis]